MPHIQIEGCSTMWKGITVREGGTLEMNMMTTIQDAQYAVNVQKGGTAIIESCHFTDNNIGIRTAPEGSGAYNITALGNIFETSEPGLKPAYSGQSPSPGTRGFAGIYTRDMTGGLTIDGDGLFQLSNQFTKLHYGILAENTDVTVRHAKFVDIALATRPSGYPGPLQMGKGVYVSNGKADVKGSFTGIAPQPAVFYESHTGIEVSNGTVDVAGCEMSGLNNGVVAVGGANRAYTINWNNISASERGISVFYQSGLPGLSIIGNNTINMTGHAGGVGIGVGGTEMFPQNEGLVLNNAVTVTEGATGILAGVSTRLKITQNTVNLAGAGALFGIRMEGGDRNTINCNTILNPGNGDNDGIYAIHPSRAGILCNTADGPPRGIHFEGMLAGKSKAQMSKNTMKNNAENGLLLGVDALIGEQRHQGNKWEGGLTMAQHLTPPVAGFSKFYVDNNEDTRFMPDLSLPQGWFEDEQTPGTTDANCYPGSSCPLPAEPPSTTELDRKIAKAEQIGSTYQAAQLWLGQRRLYEKLTEEGNPYTGDPDFNNFLAVAQNNGLSQYAFIQSGIRQLGAMTESTRASAAANLLTLNNNLSASTTYQFNEKAVNEIFLQTVAIGQLSFNATQLSLLAAIANSCPLSGGEAVLRARALLNAGLGTPVIYNDEMLCNAQRPSEGRSVLEAGKNKLSIYPNPASDQLIIDYILEDHTKSNFFLLNSLGQIVKQISFNDSSGTTNLVLDGLPSGMYWYKVLPINDASLSGKIFIVH
ncbi:MAG: T9SS type A sorting domain-containing protein [Saprospiraceae bacterium]|nr:T9SS type A sorting domain-containing protein [Saprospiraceae bacterium]